jgi:hypothetical protein
MRADETGTAGDQNPLRAEFTLASHYPDDSLKCCPTRLHKLLAKRIKD